MRVVAFAPALSASEEETGGVALTGFPMTSCYVDELPAQLTIPIVVAVYGTGGSDYDPELLLTATGPDGQRAGAMQFAWHWDDNPPAAVKYRVFAQYLPIRVEATGLYTLGLQETKDAGEPTHAFPLPIYRRNILVPNQ